MTGMNAGALIQLGSKYPARDKASEQSLMKACVDFESVFLSLLWKEMCKSTQMDLGGWDGMAQHAVGAKWAGTGGIGLAKVIYSRLTNHPL